jgi:hypothetical protein
MFWASVVHNDKLYLNYIIGFPSTDIGASQHQFFTSLPSRQMLTFLATTPQIITARG